MKRVFFSCAALLAAIAFLALPAAATQAAPTAEFDDLVEVSEVLLDVLVTDGDGKVVVGLGPDDFVIEEADGELAASGASFYSNRFLVRDDDRTKVRHPAANEIPADRHFILFFHDQARDFTPSGPLVAKQLEAVRESQRWVREEMLQGDWVAVVSYDYKLKVHRDFSQDREDILAAIKDAAVGREPANMWTSRRPEPPAVGQPSLLRNLPQGNDLRKATRRVYFGLEVLAEATRDIVGRKNLMLFTIGFGDVRNRGLSSRGDARYYPPLRQALNDNNVAVYPIDLTPPEIEHVQVHFLTQLANDTGGRFYDNVVNFITPLRHIADEANGYYLLSYQAIHPAGETGYRKVRVRTKNPDFKVRTRQGYRYGV